MAKNIETLAKKLGAEMVGTVPDYSAGAFGIAALSASRYLYEPSSIIPSKRALLLAFV
jgi:hypothetical protein